ncbi:5-formyltetrahydrofolate cyclo-ligase [Marinobacteraceae bacterium S3BR75-40.1]
MTSISRHDTVTRRQLRRSLRAARRNLSRHQQRQAGLKLARALLSHPAVQRSRHIGIYLPNDGEIDPTPFITLARRHGKICYLPVLHPVFHNRLWFYRFDADTRLKPNRFGIPEPALRNGARRAAWSLDLVLLPLVGFDLKGGRLGMGGGFYDRTFAYRLRGYHGPALLGLAHALQQVNELPVAAWDVPLDDVVTDHGAISQAGSQTREMKALVAGETLKNPPRFFGRYRLRLSRFGIKHSWGY